MQQAEVRFRVRNAQLTLFRSVMADEVKRNCQNAYKNEADLVFIHHEKSTGLVRLGNSSADTAYPIPYEAFYLNLPDLRFKSPGRMPILHNTAEVIRWISSQPSIKGTLCGIDLDSS